ncbi:helix-turn-helix and ligand-binding sensor domain-containing protein [Zobellia sp. B3R18]|uniref:helix-turn-helix and ligand-binding sensor domain-containing protein n=1 Tax=Zobellia sp. B3R18 TaxID=2841568 RepID=UPI001C07908D|nr:triple tyrosine motif-containing protein [Zobellia sp. B3R18]MBU2975566.1 LuxR C-terminal-related transcriptional regulator [Zobellia sp. B3R18]
MHTSNNLCFFRLYKLAIALLFGLQFLHAQETPPIVKFSASEYGAENQNWDVTQNLQGYIYVANNEGLLEYNGSRWTLYPSFNNTAIRSLSSYKDKVYSGSYMEFGYWTKNNKGAMDYHSISESIKEKLFEDEIIWNIEGLDKYVIFQSYDRLYFYDTDSKQLNFSTDKENNYRIFKVGQKIYLQKYDGRIFNLENGTEKLIATIPENLNVKFLLNMFSVNNGLVVLTRTKGLYKIEDRTLKKWRIPADTLLQNARVFRGIQLKDKSFMLGTISKGIISMSTDGQMTGVINQKNGLSNNTVLNLFEDADANVWAALDNGLDCINRQSYIREYNDRDGTFGTTYASITHNEKLYIGTNQGLFYKNLGSDESLKFIKGTEGQVWSLYSENDQLLCGHNNGVFSITGNTASLVAHIDGVWNFKPIPNRPHKLLIGHYSGLAILEKDKGSWKLDHKIKGFEISSRFVEILDTHEIWVNHETKGIYRLILNNDLLSFDSATLLPDVEKSKASGIVKVNNDLLYTNQNGIFKLQPRTNKFTKDSILSPLISDGEYLSGKLVFDQRERLWSFKQTHIGYTQKGPLNNMVDFNSIPIGNNWRKMTLSFENISQIDNNKYLIGKTNGYLLIDLDKVPNKPHQLMLDKVGVTKSEKETRYVSILKKGQFSYKESTLDFHYSVPQYGKYTNVSYQYRLEGLDDSWSEWSPKPSVTFEKLPFGDYEFRVQSKIGNHASLNTVQYNFVIARPFYLSNLALLAYALLIFGLGFIVHKSYKTYYRRQNKKNMLESQRELQLKYIKSEQEMTRLTNEKLNQEIESKNRELAISTMSLVKRNELLRRVKKELKKSNDLFNKTHPVIKLIDKNLNSSKDRKIFMEAFNSTDRDFLTRAKELHPNLSSNDLKFCAYLRLNLSSKEIAPLLNISVKSVEVRRSRLRKKLNLNRETKLTDYILSI